MSQPPKSVQDALLILVVAYLYPLVYVHIKVGRRRRRSSSSSNKKYCHMSKTYLRGG